jgi:hypothetical protein
MGEETFCDKIRGFIAKISFEIYLWAKYMTLEEYLTEIYLQEKRYREKGDNEDDK